MAVNLRDVPLEAIAFDAGTQIRAALDGRVVDDYAERMSEGVVFPPIVLFHDGTAYYLADGFHRYMASQRVGFKSIVSDVRAGTKDDALWFALGANKTNGVRLTERDKQHAVAVALRAWPEKMQREIAEQVGCHPSLVSEVYRKMNGSEPVLRGRALATHQKRESVRALLAAGSLDSVAIAKKAHVSRSLVSEIRGEMGLSKIENSQKAIASRHERMRAMAAEGYTSRQIADAIGIGADRVRELAKREGVDIAADRIVGKTKLHDSTRIITRIVMDAENLTDGYDLIDFSDINRADLAGWLDSLKKSRDRLSAFIRRLMQEQQSNGEAA